MRLAKYLLTAAFAILSGSNIGVAAALPPVKSVKGIGSGCRSGIQLTPVGSNSLLVSFSDQFALSANPGDPLSAGRGSCVADFRLAKDTAFNTTLISTAYAGEVDLWGAPKLNFSMTYFFAGGGFSGKITNTWSPSTQPLKGVWKDPKAVPINPANYITSQCARDVDFQMNFAMTLINRRSNASSGGTAQANYILLTFQTEDCSL